MSAEVELYTKETRDATLRIDNVWCPDCDEWKAIDELILDDEDDPEFLQCPDCETNLMEVSEL